MIDVALRAGMLLAVAGLAWFAVARWERRHGPAVARFRPGITVITGPGCRLCDPVVRKLRRAGAEPWMMDVAEVPAGAVGASSLPVVVVVDGAGDVVMRRAGRAALEDAGLLAEAVVGA